MYQSHWGLQAQPFGDARRGGAFYQSPTHEEALARLYFLVEQRRRLGLLLGAPGSGKSLLLSVFAHELRQAGGHVAATQLQGLEPVELLWELAVQLGLNPPAPTSVPELWRMLNDRLAEHRFQQWSTVILLDDADQAAPRVLDQVLRLDRQASATGSELTLVLTARPDRVMHLGVAFTELTDLRIDLTPWDLDETEGYLRSALEQAGCRRAVFDPEAVARLHELTGGIPRRVSRLADLALLAGAGQGLEHIDAEVVQSVYRELEVAPCSR